MEGVGDEAGALAAAGEDRGLAALLDIEKIIVSSGKRARLLWCGKVGGEAWRERACCV